MAANPTDALLQVLRTEGVRHVFGNPGSTELPLIDALATADDLHYVLALQEATAVGMADGYAQATGRPAFLNLHTAAGLGNAIGNLTNAVANASPLVVTAGQQDERHLAADPMLSGDLVRLAAPVSKWAHEVRNAGELGTMLRRAFHDAMAPPRGPVFVSLPMSTLDGDGAVDVPAVSRIDVGTVAGSLEALADALTQPAVGSVAIVAGDEVSASGAIDELVSLAEALGAPVFGAPLHATGVFPPAHPLYRGMLAPNAAAIRATLTPFERVFLVGGQAFLVYPYSDGPPLPEGTDLIHLSPTAAWLGRAHPTILGAVGDPRLTLAALVPLVAELSDADATGAALQEARVRRHHELAQFEEVALARYGPAPMHPMAAAHALVRALPPDTPVVDEAITTGGFVRNFHHWSSAGRYWFCKGGGLGWGMPASLGVSLAMDRGPVLCVVGDGSAMYSPQALWTAAHEQLPVVFAVVNNRKYLILENWLRTRKGASVAANRFVATDLDAPPVDFVGLAASLGLAASRVDATADVTDAVQAALATGKPALIEVPIAVAS